jgi:mannose-6-phosphate isomerase-like protein (cupin superfamily)
MAKTGDVIESPPTGERIRFVKTSGDTDGEVLQLDYTQAPGGFVAAEHMHPIQEETFHIEAGRPRFTIDGVNRDASPGETLVVPPRVRHVFRNPTDAQVRVTIELRPALNSEGMFTSLYSLALRGKVNRMGIPRNLLTAALFAQEFRNEVRPVGWMRALVVFAPFAAGLARLLRMRLDQ